MVARAYVSRKLSWMEIVLFSGCGLLPAQNPPQFTITEVGALPGFQASQGTAISSSGIIVGFSTSPGFSFSKSGSNGVTSEGWIFTKGVLKDLGNSGQAVTIPLGVNDSEQVVGLIADASGNSAASEFFLQDSKFVNPTSFRGSAVPYAINNAGQTSETLNPGRNGQVAGFWSGLSENPLTLLQGATMAWGNGINAFGQVAGASSDGTTIVPIVWNNGEPRTFSLPAGLAQGMAFAINNGAVAAGFVFNAGSSNTHAALFNKGGSVDLGALATTQDSVASGVNDSGWVVGFSTPSRIDISNLASGLNALAAFSAPTEITRAVVWINGAIHDLNALVTNGSGWTLSYAAGINNLGQIVGTGFHNGQQTAFVLTPTNEPTRPVISGIVGSGMRVPVIRSNGWFSIYGRNFTSSSQPPAAVSSTYSTSLAQTCVQVGNTLAELNFVSATQINALVPSVPADQPVPISVISNCGTSAASASLVLYAPVMAPSLGFLYWDQTANGQNPVVAVEVSNGTLVGPPGTLPDVRLVPARQGDLVTIYYAGGASPDSVTIGGQFAAVIDLGVTPANPGLPQINIIVPHGLTPGNQPIVVTINGVASPPGAFLAVGQ